MIPTSAVIQHRNVHNMFFSWIFAHLQKIMNPMEKSTHEAKLWHGCYYCKTNQRQPFHHAWHTKGQQRAECICNKKSKQSKGITLVNVFVCFLLIPFQGLWCAGHSTSFTYTSENKFQLKFKPKKSCSGWTLNVSSVRMSLPSFKAFVLLNRIYIYFFTSTQIKVRFLSFFSFTIPKFKLTK